MDFTAVIAALLLPLFGMATSKIADKFLNENLPFLKEKKTGAYIIGVSDDLTLTGTSVKTIFTTLTGTIVNVEILLSSNVNATLAADNTVDVSLVVGKTTASATYMVELEGYAPEIVIVDYILEILPFDMYAFSGSPEVTWFAGWTCGTPSGGVTHHYPPEFIFRLGGATLAARPGHTYTIESSEFNGLLTQYLDLLSIPGAYDRHRWPSNTSISGMYMKITDNQTLQEYWFVYNANIFSECSNFLWTHYTSRKVNFFLAPV